jgi:hypothetical protein
MATGGISIMSGIRPSKRRETSLVAHSNVTASFRYSSEIL